MVPDISNLPEYQIHDQITRYRVNLVNLVRPSKKIVCGAGRYSVLRSSEIADVYSEK